MKIPNHFTLGKNFLHAIKIGVGSALAMFIAHQMKLEFVTSAGIITLLTITETKLETKRLCLNRLITFILTVGICLFVFEYIERGWAAYGVVAMSITFISSYWQMLSTLSVNAVIATHFLVGKVIDWQSILNELLLLLIGMGIAIMVNQFHDYQNQQECLDDCILRTEKMFQEILTELADFLVDDTTHDDVWQDIFSLEEMLFSFQTLAFQYQQNRLPEKEDYYVKYFEMRMQQCGILHNLHCELSKIRSSQSESEIIAEYFDYIKKYLDESNHPVEQLRCLRELLDNIAVQNLPQSPVEFYSKARLYHILRDIEEFLTFKKRFIEANAKNATLPIVDPSEAV